VLAWSLLRRGTPRHRAEGSRRADRPAQSSSSTTQVEHAPARQPAARHEGSGRLGPRARSADAVSRISGWMVRQLPHGCRIQLEGVPHSPETALPAWFDAL